MARSRNIKPGFFKNYELADIGPLAQILFAGLWCLADRQGRLEDKPRLIKAEIFPYYDCDVNGELTKLQRLKLVDRYVVDGVAVISVVNFKKHQTPHNTEKQSTLPAMPDGYENTSIESTPCNDNGGFTVDSRNNNGGKTPDSLNTDSLIPDSLIGQDKPAKQAKRRSQIPDDFYPNDDNLFSFNKTRLNLGQEIGKFMDYHKAKGSVMADWQAAWRTWVANGVKFAKPAPAESFKERDDRNARKRWEAMTGMVHPDNIPNHMEVFDADHLMLGVSQ